RVVVVVIAGQRAAAACYVSNCTEGNESEQNEAPCHDSSGASRSRPAVEGTHAPGPEHTWSGGGSRPKFSGHAHGAGSSLAGLEEVAERVVVDERDREPDEVAADDNAGEARLAERLRDGDCDRRHGRKDVEDVRRPVGEEDERVVREVGADHPGEGPQGERVPKPPRTPSDVRES